MIQDSAKLVNYICDEIKAFCDTAVIGLSGGADSSLVAVLCMKALGAENVYGISMPFNEYDSKTFNSMSASLAVKIGINHLVRPVGEIANSINNQIYIESEQDLTAVNSGNSRSRARMCVLYGIAHTLSTKFCGKRVRVIGTGNLSEDFIGYDTKGGDALADLFPIGTLFKSEVYALLEYFRDQGVIEEENINRVPSAGLVKDQTDEKDLGYSYNTMEKSVRFLISILKANNNDYSAIDRNSLDEVTRFVLERHLAHKHKHEAPRVIDARHLCD